MKVNQVKGASSNVSGVKRQAEAPGSKFSDLLDDNRERQSKEHLEKLMKNIKDQGEQLIDSKNIEVLVQYKRMVKDFVSQAVDYAFQIQERKGLSRMGRSKVLKVVSQVDSELVTITEAFLDEERSRIKLLAKIGELQGLLMNLFV